MSDQPAVPIPEDAPNPVELIELIEQLDADNERLRMKSLDLMRLMEEVVDREVAGERRIEELEQRIAELERGDTGRHDAVSTRLARAIRAIRAVLHRLRRRMAS